MLLLPMKMEKNAEMNNVTPVYEDDKEMQLLLMLLMPMKMKHMDWTLPKIYLNVQTILIMFCL